MTISLHAAHSKLADPARVAALQLDPPAGKHLSAHQVATYEATALSAPGQVVFNTALTGDGKSLANFLAQWRGRVRHPKLLTAYPTNELIRDQHVQALRDSAEWTTQPQRICSLDAAALDELTLKLDFARQDALSHVFSNDDVVLTNPDIFHSIMQSFYVRNGKRGDAPDKIFGPMLSQIRQFTFDEFHIFQAPQIVAITNALLLIRAVTGAKCPQFLFLSATPNPMMLDYFGRAGISPIVIKGQYTHGEQSDPNAWRLILRAVKLDLLTERLDEWVLAHVDDVILPFFRVRGRGAKGAIIVNSIVTARRLTERLRPVFEAHGLRVDSNTGLDTRSERTRSYEADLLIGTSTVDVGMDFKINLLIFEGGNAGTFLQRLGRLGRHDGFARDGQFHAFQDFRAYAFVPSWVHETLFVGRDGGARLLTDGDEIDRETFADAIRNAYPDVATFDHYGKDWGGLQAARNIHSLRNATIRDSYTGTREQLATQYECVLNTSMKYEMGRLVGLSKQQRALHDEALSFRGSSLFTCGILDVQAENEARIKHYDLFRLLTDFELTALSKAEFEAEARRFGWTETALKRLEAVGYFRLLGVRTERLNIEVVIQQDPSAYDNDWFDKAIVLQGIEVLAQGADGLSTINRSLRQKHLPALISQRDRFELTRRLRLPMPFPLYSAVARGGQPVGAVAFGRTALLLDTVLRRRRDLHNHDSALIT